MSQSLVITKSIMNFFQLTIVDDSAENHRRRQKLCALDSVWSLEIQRALHVVEDSETGDFN